MPISDWAEQEGVTRVGWFPAWLDQHPEVAAEILDARAVQPPWSFPTISRWLAAVHGVTVSPRTLCHWVHDR